MHGCHSSGNGQGKKILQGQGKVRRFNFESEKIDILMKSRKIEIITPLIMI